MSNLYTHPVHFSLHYGLQFHTHCCYRVVYIVYRCSVPLT